MLRVARMKEQGPGVFLWHLYSNLPALLIHVELGYAQPP
jgi:hypothetical protein